MPLKNLEARKEYRRLDEVEPVCGKCNYKRGPAIPWAEKETVL